MYRDLYEFTVVGIHKTKYDREGLKDAISRKD